MHACINTVDHVYAYFNEEHDTQKIIKILKIHIYQSVFFTYTV